jgi:hypothetical protein
MYPWDKTDLIMVYDLFDMLLNLFAYILLRIVASLILKTLACNFLFVVSLSNIYID